MAQPEYTEANCNVLAEKIVSEMDQSDIFNAAVERESAFYNSSREEFFNQWAETFDNTEGE